MYSLHQQENQSTIRQITGANLLELKTCIFLQAKPNISSNRILNEV